jgi:hypothetical protein
MIRTLAAYIQVDVTILAANLSADCQSFGNANHR